MGGNVFSHDCLIMFVVWDCSMPIVKRGERKRLCAGIVFPSRFTKSNCSFGSAGESTFDRNDSSHVDRLDSCIGSGISCMSLDSSTPSIDIELIDCEVNSGDLQISTDDAVESSTNGGVSTSGCFPLVGADTGLGGYMPYTGEFKGSSWNTQALFAASTRRHLRKRSRATALMHSNDFVCFQETHALEGKTIAFAMPPGHCAVWANGSLSCSLALLLSLLLVRFETLIQCLCKVGDRIRQL